MNLNYTLVFSLFTFIYFNFLYVLSSSKVSVFCVSYCESETTDGVQPISLHRAERVFFVRRKFAFAIKNSHLSLTPFAFTAPPFCSTETSSTVPDYFFFPSQHSSFLSITRSWCILCFCIFPFGPRMPRFFFFRYMLFPILPLLSQRSSELAHIK